MDPASFFARIPLQPHQLTERFTPTSEAIVLCHLGVPRIAADEWSLSVGGLVRKPLRLTYDDLLRRPAVEIAAVHQCAGSPLEPALPKRRVCNVVWTGLPLSALLEECGVLPEARFIWSTGLDWGSFAGHRCDSYVKDLPIERAGADVLIAYRVNGEPLPPESGFPARLVVPGFYGTNSVKWISKIELADRRAGGLFTTTLYNDPVRNEAQENTQEKRPVWAIAPESLVVFPSPDMSLPLGDLVEIWGWAWGDGGVETLEVSVDGGADWFAAHLELPQGRTWQKYRFTWLPQREGEHILCCRATNSHGISQPMSGARNAIHRVRVKIAASPPA